MEFLINQDKYVRVTSNFLPMTYLALVLLIFFLALPSQVAAGRGYALELILYYEGGEYTYKTTVKRSLKYKLESDPRGTLKPYILKAKSRLAIKRGYPPVVYGKDHYKMVNVKKYYWQLIDTRSDEIILHKKR